VVYAYSAQLDVWRNERAPGAVPCASDSDSRHPPPGLQVVRPSNRSDGLILILAGANRWADVVRARALGVTTVQSQPRTRSLAVLPLENFSGNPDQDYLSDGMTEALISRLSTIHACVDLPHFRDAFQGHAKVFAAIGKELNVDAVVEGSVLRSGDKIRITVQLIRVDTTSTCGRYV